MWGLSPAQSPAPCQGWTDLRSPPSQCFAAGVSSAQRALGFPESPLLVQQSSWEDACAGGKVFNSTSRMLMVSPRHGQLIPDSPACLPASHQRVPQGCKHFGFPASPAQAPCRFRACCRLKTYQVSSHLPGTMNLQAGGGAGATMTLLWNGSVQPLAPPLGPSVAPQPAGLELCPAHRNLLQSHRGQSPVYWNQLLFPSSAGAPRDIPSIGYLLQLRLVWCPGYQLCRWAQSWGQQRVCHSCQPNKPGLRGQDIFPAASTPLGHASCIPAAGKGGISDAVSAGTPLGSGKHELYAHN